MTAKRPSHINTTVYEQLDEEGLEEVSLLNKNYKVLFEMLIQRGHDIPEEDKAFMSLDSKGFFNYFVQFNLPSFYDAMARVYSRTGLDGSKKNTLILFHHSTNDLFNKKDFTNAIAKVQQFIFSQGYNPSPDTPVGLHNVILAVNRLLDSQAKEVSKSPYGFTLEVFHQDNLLLNPNRHFLVPKHSVDERITFNTDGTVNRASLKGILKTMMVSDPNKLAHISSDDPIMTFNEYPIGSLIRIDRVRINSTNLVDRYPTYRYLTK